MIRNIAISLQIVDDILDLSSAHTCHVVCVKVGLDVGFTLTTNKEEAWGICCCYFLVVKSVVDDELWRLMCVFGKDSNQVGELVGTGEGDETRYVS